MDSIRSDDKNASKIPKDLLKMVDELASNVKSAHDLTPKIIALAKKYEVPNDLLENVIKSALRAHLIPERTIDRMIPQELKRQYPKHRKRVLNIRQIDEIDESKVIEQSDTIEIKNDQDAEMEAIAQRIEPKPEPEEDLNLAEPIRIVTFSKPEEAVSLIRNYINKLKARGWKVVEIQARYIS